jgi:chondroitin 4-sulfotransferase 11
MISHHQKFVFIHIPKCAGNSLKPGLGLKGNKHMMASSVGKKVRDEYFTFCFTRNPWDRVVSAYFYLKKGGTTQLDSQDRNTYIKPYPSFESFIFNMDYAAQNQQHFKPQVYYADEELDFYGKVENLQEDFNIICNKIGIPQHQVPHRNKSEHKHYTEYYDDETRQIVAKKYAKDIEYFGYEFES